MSTPDFAKAFMMLRDRDHAGALAIADAADTATASPAVRARASLVRGLQGLIWGGSDQALSQCLACLAELEQLDDCDDLAWAYGATAFRLGMAGDPERGLEFIGRGEALHEQCPTPRDRMEFCNYRGCLLGLLEEWEQAQQMMVEAAGLAAELALPRHQALYLANQAFNQLMLSEQAQHRHDEAAARHAAARALTLIQRGLSLVDGEPDSGSALHLRGTRNFVLLALGEAEQARAGLAALESLALPPQLRTDWLHARARLQAHDGQLDPARASLDEAIAMARGSVHAHLLPRLLRDRIELEARFGCWPEALAWAKRRTEYLDTNLRRRLQMATRHAEASAEAARARIQAQQAHEQAEALACANLALSQSQQSWRERAMRDPLTGLYNRAAFEAAVQSMWEADQPFSLAIIDADHFKRVNDSLGHAMGDEVLKTLARLLQQSCRQGDVLARLGGEEFVLLLPRAEGQALSQAQRGCERLCQRVAHHDWSSLHPELAVTISLGLADRPQAPTWPALLERADQALYQAKREGRNRLVSSV